MERPTNQKQEEKKTKRAKEGWKGQRTQGRVLTRGKGYKGKRKKHNEELRNERRECDKEKENVMMTQTKPQKKGKANERQLSNKETEEKESCNFFGGRCYMEGREYLSRGRAT